MTCWHFRLRRKFLPYLEGELQPKDVRRLEKHLLNCEPCRADLLRLRSGHELAQELRHFRPQAEHPEFDAVMAAAGRAGFSHRDRSLAWESWLDGLATPRAVELLTLLVVVQLALLVFSNRTILFGARHGITVKPTTLSWSEFHQLSIPELKSNTQPHIATEGFVSDVHADDEEGTVQFKLAQNPQGRGPFVICEIMSSQMEVPREGSYVRVYGVARYDAQTDRKWNEINPVLNIAPVRH